MGPLVLLAQAAAAQSVDPALGVTGWTSAGLLGMVLGWLLLRHIPEKDRQSREMIVTHGAQLEAKDAKMAALIERHDRNVDELTARHEAHVSDLAAKFDRTLARMEDNFGKALTSVIAQSERRTVEIVAALHEELGRHAHARAG